MNPFTRFMQSPAGRSSRAVAGIALVAGGILGVGGSAGYLLAGIGLVPLGAGLFDICVMGPIFKIPFRGAKIRAMK